jgi:signal transduction histidine kinase/CheY-like chemotaxis protein
VVAGSLNYQTTLESVARLAVPYMADFCIVDLVGEDQQIRRVATAHADAEKAEVLCELQQEHAPDWSSPQPAARVLRSGHPEVVPEVDETWLLGASRDEDHLRLWRELDPVSYMAVPLIARGTTIGVISFGYTSSGRRYGPGDPALARDLAGRAAAAIDNARLFKEVQEAGRRKDEFLAMLAHELRNPLAAISNASYAMGELGAADGRRLQRLRAVIVRQAQHLARLVDDLLDISRITRGKIELRRERVELRELIEESVEATRPFIEGRGHALVVTLPKQPVWLEADPTRLEQVLCNLLNNAAKYTQQRGEISVSAELVRHGKDPFVQVRVRDTGVGISPDLLPCIFDLFTQAEQAADRSQGGLGIGLALVRNLVQMHGGRVEAHSSGPGQGSEFCVCLPVLEQVEPEPPPGPANNGFSPTAARRARVLLVEDNPDAAETLTEMLQMWGHEVRAVDNGPAALDLAPDYRPEVVLMDIGLPGMNGYEAAARLREGSPSPMLLVAMTGYGMEESRRRSAEAGFDQHLTKPVDPAELQRLLATAPARQGEPAPGPPAG